MKSVGPISMAPRRNWMPGFAEQTRLQVSRVTPEIILRVQPHGVNANINLSCTLTLAISKNYREVTTG